MAEEVNGSLYLDKSPQRWVFIHQATVDGNHTIESAVLAGPVTLTGTVTVTGTLVVV
jgi:hypothetical protein